jgi:hypothetical protein
MTVILDSKRRLTLPTALLSTKPGQVFDARYDADEDALVFRLIPSKEDWLDVMSQCPEPMDDLPPRRRELAKKRKL